MRNIILLFIIISFAFVGNGFAGVAGKVTVRVLDEEGNPVANAEAKVTFKFSKAGGIGLNTKAEVGSTDKNGLFSTSGQGMNSVSISAMKDGFYKSGRGYEFTSHSKLLNRWEPWNPTVEVVLKKKRNPVPMYIGGTDWIEVPKLDALVGYDLEKGDWVAPYGTGTINDFYITCHSDVRAYADYDVSIDLSFTDGPNGIQEYFFDKNDQSYYKWPFSAPLEGYKSTLHKELRKQFPGKGITTNAQKDVNYLFRVRSKVDAQGNLISAYYGKIFGEIGFDAGNNGGCTFSIHYYFNPDGTRNLEEDPDKNLFRNKR